MVSTGLLRVLVAVSCASCVYGNYFIACPNTFRPETDFSCEISYTMTTAARAEVTLGIQEQAPLASSSRDLNNGRALVTLSIPANVPEGTYTLTVVGRNPFDGSELFRNSTILQDESDNSLLLIQINKPMFKPMQSVKFRIVCVDQQLKPRTLPTDIAIFDQNDNKLEEWLGVNGQGGVIEKSFQLSDLPPLGQYRIQAKNMYAMTSKEFDVEKYVLPKFEVTAEADPGVLSTRAGENKQFTVRVKAKYTFGKDVVGKATFIFGERMIITKTAVLNYDAEGFHSESFSLDEFSRVKSWNSLKFSVNVTETSTMVNQSSNQVTIRLYDRPKKMEFLPTSTQVFRPGQDVKLQLKVTNIVDNTPTGAGQSVEISTYIASEQMKKMATVDIQGMAEATFTIPENVKTEYDISFSANLQEDGYTLRAYYSVKPYRAKLNATVTVESPTMQPFAAGGSFDIQISSTGAVERIAFLVLARGVVVDSGLIQKSGEVYATQTINVQREMSPQANVIIYGLVRVGTTYEIVADSITVQVQGVFDNQVSLEFSKIRSRAGETVDVTVRSEANSKYYILAVDKSVMLLGTGNDLAKADVRNKIRKFSLGKTPSYTDGPEPHFEGRGDALIMPRPGGSTNDAPTSAGEIFTAYKGGSAKIHFQCDLHTMTVNKGLLYMTGMVIMTKSHQRLVIMRKQFIQNSPVNSPPIIAESAVDSPAAGSQPPTQYAEVGSVRKSFPEAWLWEDGMLNNQGVATLSKTVPDTITEWQATAFTMSETKGLAITDMASKLTSFQPFFVSLTLPYAMTRGEIFQLRVTVNNYIEPRVDIKVKVTLKKSDEYDIAASAMQKLEDGGVYEEIMVKSNMPGLVIFKVSAKKLGPVKLNVVAQPDSSVTSEKGDSLVRTVLVKPEGIVQNKVIGETIELDANSNAAFNKNVSIFFPQEFVKDSKRVEIKVTGDIMGPTVEGLEKLIRMPYGCGEQNMITLVPNIVVHGYLETVGRLTIEIKDKAINNMKAGYQRELQYLRKDGAFSAFGDSDTDGSTWLTAFVMKCFSQARNEITVDSNIMKGAYNFVKGSQKNDGTFELKGNVIHKEMQGRSVQSKAASTAFIYIALKESISFLTDKSALDKALSYLENSAANDMLNGTYEMAIVAYALTLADSAKAGPLLAKIQEREKPWNKPDPVPMPVEGDEARKMMHYYPPKAKSIAIETWSYVLLAYAKRKEIVMGREIMKWLLSQQNDMGGFRSTQDTVTGLTALAEYAAVVYEAPQTDITLRITSNKDSHEFRVQKNELLLLQSYVFDFPDDTTFVELSATGRGLALVKILWQYNTMKEEKPIDIVPIITEILPEKISEDLYRIRCCFKSTDEDLGMMMMSLQKQTQMSLANREELEQDRNIKRVDEDGDEVNLYFDKSESTFQCANVNMQRDAPVENLKAASFKAYAYYQPEYSAEELYTVVEATEGDGVCSICQGETCPDHCDKCKNCGRNCPSECDTSGAKTWKYDGMLLAMTICFLLSLIMAL